MKKLIALSMAALCVAASLAGCSSSSTSEESSAASASTSAASAESSAAASVYVHFCIIKFFFSTSRTFTFF